MLPSFNILNIFILLGSLQGFLLALMFATGEKFKRTSNQFLALLLLSISLLNLKNGMFAMGLLEQHVWLRFLPWGCNSLVPFALYYYFQFLIHPKYQFKPKEYLLLVPFLVDFLFQSCLLVFYLFQPSYLDEYKQVLFFADSVFESISIAYCLIVLLVLLKQLNLFQKELYNYYAEIENKSLVWLKHIFIAIILLWFLWAIPFVYNHFFVPLSLHYSFYPLWIGLAVIVYWLGYSTYLRRDLFETPTEVNLNPAIVIENVEKNSPELSVKTEEHYQNVLQLMEQDKLYQNPSLSMSILAERTGLSNGYLSQIINQKEGKNFFEFVNYYRVEEVKKHLVDEKFAHYSILGIGMEAGFKSKSTFNAVFKKMTGKTPSAYKRGAIN